MDESTKALLVMGFGTTGYFGDRENEVEPKLYEFLKGQLMDGWGEGYEYYDYVISFKE